MTRYIVQLSSTKGRDNLDLPARSLLDALVRALEQIAARVIIIKMALTNEEITGSLQTVKNQVYVFNVTKKKGGD